MNRKVTPILLAAGLLVSACADRLDVTATSPDAAAGTVTRSEKIINTSEQSRPGVLLLKLSEIPSDEVRAKLMGCGLEDLQPVFPSTPGKEELERRFGLDRWYEATLSDSQTADQTANALCAFNEVETVQFDEIFRNEESEYVFPVSEAEMSFPAATRAAEDLPFNDPLLHYQWGYINTGDVSLAEDIYKGADINVKSVWKNLCAGDPDIIVAVIDEAVKYNHPDLAANMWVNEAEKNGKPGVDDDGNGYVDDIYGYNFVRNGELHWDGEGNTGHGTHCAGTIAAVNNNGIGVSGIAGGTGKGDGCRIMSCQIYDEGGGGDSRIAAKAIKYAADMGASIISCSFGYTGGTYKSDAAYRNGNNKTNQVEYDALKYFEATKNNPVVDGGIPIFSAGNDGDPYATYPGALYDIISVSAFGPDYLPTYYTNYGPGCNIVAPGGEYLHKVGNSYPPQCMILSCYPSELGDSWDVVNKDYSFSQGTSMACPHVSGVVALALSYAKKLGKTYTTQKFKELLLSSANDFDSRLKGEKKLYGKTLNLGNYRKQMGTGSIDAYIFMMQIEGIPCLTAEIGRNQWIDVSQYFGTSSVNLTYLGEPGKEEGQVLCEVSDEDRASLGLQQDPYMQYGKLYIYPTKIGSGKVKVRAIAGGNIIGGDDAIGGMEMTQEISIISRTFKSGTGGWL